MLERIVNIIKESKMDRLSMPWVMVRVSSLLSWWGTVAEDVGDDPIEQGAMVSQPPVGQDEPVYMKENVKLRLFQTQVLE